MSNTTRRISKKRSFSFRLLYYWTKLTCINPLTISDNNELRFSYCSLVYSILLSVSYTYIYYSVFIDRFKIDLPGETPIGKIGILFTVAIDFIEAVQMWIAFGFYQNRVKLIMKSFIKAEKTSLKLEIPLNLEKSLKKLVIYITVTNTIYLILWMGCTYGSSIIEDKFYNFMWLCYVLPRLLTFNRWTIFIWTLEIVKQKFQRLNDKVRLVLNDYGKITEVNRVSSRSMKNSNCNSIFLAGKIGLISQLHRELRTAIYLTMQHIAVCAVFDVLVQFLDITISVHIAYRFLKNHRQITLADFMYLADICVWIFVPVGLLALISNASGSTIDEANKTGKILHAALNDINNFCETQAIYNVFSLDLLVNQLRISVLGLFDLNHYLVFQIITTVTTFLTIMLQFYN